MAITFELKAEKRDEFGTAVSRRMRRLQGRVPAIVYGGGKQPETISLNHDEVIVALGHETFYSHVMSLTIGKKKESVILKALQRHPYKNKVQHLDFMRIKAGEKLTVKIPLHFVNEEEAPGVKEQGGTVTHHCTDVEIVCLPENLPDFIEVDVSALQLDEILHLSHLTLPAGVEIPALALGADHDAPVVAIHIPRVVEEPVVDEAETAQGEEGEAEASSEAKADDQREEKKQGEAGEKAATSDKGDASDQ